MSETLIINESTGEEIHLANTKNITKLENQLKLLGDKGLFYSCWANNIKNKIEKLKKNG